jgi:hypothetical protein
MLLLFLGESTLKIGSPPEFGNTQKPLLVGLWGDRNSTNSRQIAGRDNRGPHLKREVGIEADAGNFAAQG